ncbi:glycosyl transferase [Corynebacterium sp. 13CS0277]|uniref:glycosyltransferase family 4 protein n=1 Tax=Corynebacterium sp. 13CS0277 TaxID=2071994 RepID=UPI000D026834|nr:glycosyltransferase family 4 protein [Corynebacterium sp. 13CS0277]PRQ11847.1 glycosyl transferase [Corynebacterium sp. 13CS0277]
MNVLFLSWRDSHHPEGGGSEAYVEHIAEYLHRLGHTVTIRTARPAGSAARSTREGVAYVRGGGRHSVYPRALAWLLWRQLRRRGPDVIVDVHNGIPFFARLVTRTPVVVLSHHCHREQWPVAGAVLGRVGWFLESRLSPLVHRRTPWVTVSAPSREELVGLGVPAQNISIIRNGCDPVPAPLVELPRTRPHHVVCVARLVPHKQLEHAIDVAAACERTRPGQVALDVVGSGWWEDSLRAHIQARGVGHVVRLHGHVSEEGKHALLARASVHLMPSAKEGWGLTVMEAAQHRVPTVGYRAARGLQDSIDDGSTGLLVDTYEELLTATLRLLDDPVLRGRLGAAAQAKAQQLSWAAAGADFAQLLEAVARR